ncbi:MAG: putative corrinoid protein [Acidimicrobiia bacterium]|nr:putative corrinoid protein [Acidimicrobiia bacterium]
MTVSELTLHEAADALGVHYMTVYRYVRLGLLPARKEGSSWRVARHEIERFLNGSQEPAAARGGGRRAPWDKRLAQRLVEGDQLGAWGVVEAALAAGTDVHDLYLDVLAPAMTTVGEQWATGEIDVAVEHRASGIVARLIGRLGPRFNRRGRSRGSVVLAAPVGESHSLNLAMMADLARGAGYDVWDLGANVPTESLVEMLEQSSRLALVGIGVMADENRAAAASALAAVRATMPAVALVVGGAGVNERWVAAQPGAQFVPDGRAFLTLLTTLT